MNPNFSRDETEYGCFGDLWGATLATKATAGAAANLFGPATVKASVAAPVVKASTSSVPSAAAAPLAVKASLGSLTRALPTSALTAALSSGAISQPMIAARAPSAAVVKATTVLAAPPKPAAAVSGQGTQAQSADFFTGQTNLTAPNVKAAIVAAPVLTKEQQADLAAALKRKQAIQDGYNQSTSGYAAARASDDQEALRLNNYISTQPWNTSTVDWGLIPLGAAVLATGAAAIATGGAAVGAIAAGGISAASIGSVVTADGIVAAATKVGGKDAAKAKAVIDGTKTLASTGNVDAIKGLTTIAAVTADRAAKGVPAGVTQTAAALLPLAANPVIGEASAGGGLAVRDSGTGMFSTDLLAGVRPVGTIVAHSRPVIELAPDTVMPTDAQLAAAADARLRWTVLENGKLYRGAAPTGTGNQFRVYDSGRVAAVTA